MRRRLLRRWCGGEAGIAVMLATAACVHQAPDVHASMSVSPSTALLDAPVSVEVTGLPAGATTTITATATDAFGTAWSSAAQFTASRSGSLTLAAPPSGGSYQGADPMGLFETMTPAGAAGDTRLYGSGSGGYAVTLSARLDGRTVASAVAHRLAADPTVTLRELRVPRDGVYGALFSPPASAARKPGLLVFGGSEGGLVTASQAALLASHGYPTLALAYFNEPGLPDTLRDIPLEYFAKALALLATQPGVDPTRLVVWGVSRGSEAALLLGTHYPALVHAVIAEVPSGRQPQLPGGRARVDLRRASGARGPGARP